MDACNPLGHVGYGQNSGQNSERILPKKLCFEASLEGSRSRLPGRCEQRPSKIRQTMIFFIGIRADRDWEADFVGPVASEMRPCQSDRLPDALAAALNILNVRSYWQ